MICEEARQLLSAYQDGELAPDIRSDVEAHMESCAGCLSAYKANLRLSEEIRTILPAYLPPESLLRKLPTPKAHRPAATGFGFGLAAGLAAAMLGFVFLVPKRTDFTSELVADHVRSLMATHLMDVVSTDRHTVKPWFLGKIDFAPKVPQLRGQGFPLLGGRLDYVDGHPAVALVYGKQKHIINVLVLPLREALPAAGEANGYRVERWNEADLAYYAVSDVSRDDLKSFAQAFQASN